MSNDHPIPKALRDRFDQIEDAICRNRMERDAVFTQMRTAVQAYFMSAEPAERDERVEIQLALSEFGRITKNHVLPAGFNPGQDNFVRGFLARAALSVSTEPAAPAAVECTSCDGSGEYIDAIGDWRGYCSCPAGVELKNRPAVGDIAEQKCETCHDQGEVFVSKGKFEYGMLTEPEPIYKPCPDCAEPANKEGAQ